MGDENGKLVFALDVGTRKVCGLLVAQVNGQARVVSVSVREHSERAMLDGQVHFIEKAAQVVKRVKKDLENECGESLSQAHVAVAGRALVTQQTTVLHDLSGVEALNRALLLPLELKAVKEAKKNLADPRSASGSYCVGYAVTKTVLDGTALSSLEGHVGRKLEMTVLATFLPKLVLDSLQAVLRASGLALASLTLEPIAALDIAIPPDLRRLNLALVDVGAGTSDIAITRAGVVNSFAMVPLAGDEVTEALCDKYLLDFEQAEIVKRLLSHQPKIEALDIFSKPVSIDSQEALETLKPVIEVMAQSVADSILELNGGQIPQAVLLVGGGSQVESLDKHLAEKIGLSPSRVGHRPPNLQKDFSFIPDSMKEVWAITPLGIALIALRGRGLPFMSFRVNDQKVQVLNLNQRIAAFDALLASGHEMKEFYGKPGLALTYTLNGQSQVLKGGMGSPAKILINGSETVFDHEIQEGDNLIFHEACAGTDGALTVAEALANEGQMGFHVFVNGERRELSAEVTIDGASVSRDEAVLDRAEIVSRLDRRADHFLKKLGYEMDGLLSRDITVQVDGVPKVLHQRNYRLKINEREAALDRNLSPNDKVEFEPGMSFQERVRDLLTRADQGSLSVKINGDWVRIPFTRKKLLMNGREVSVDEFLIDGADIKTVARENMSLSLEEVMKQVSLDTSAFRNGVMRVTVNGEKAERQYKILDGAEISVEVGESHE